MDTKRAEVAGQSVPLTGKEYQMLELLAHRRGTPVTKDMFLSHLYGGRDEPGLKIIDVFMCKLHKKLAAASRGADYIETARLSMATAKLAEPGVWGLPSWLMSLRERERDRVARIIGPLDFRCL